MGEITKAGGAIVAMMITAVFAFMFLGVVEPFASTFMTDEVVETFVSGDISGSTVTVDETPWYQGTFDSTSNTDAENRLGASAIAHGVPSIPNGCTDVTKIVGKVITCTGTPTAGSVTYLTRDNANVGKRIFQIIPLILTIGLVAGIAFNAYSSFGGAHPGKAGHNVNPMGIVGTVVVFIIGVVLLTETEVFIDDYNVIWGFVPGFTAIGTITDLTELMLLLAVLVGSVSGVFPNLAGKMKSTGGPRMGGGGRFPV